MASEDIILRLRVIGGRQAAGELQQVAVSAGRVEKSGGGAAKSTKGLGGALGGLRGGMGMVGRLAGAAGFAGVGVSALAAVKSGLQFNASLESSRTRFRLFTHSAAEAAKVVDEVNNVAAKSTFARTDLANVAARLGTAGVTGDRLTKTLQGVANAAAAAGGQSSNLDGVTLALQQMSSASKVNRGDLNQLASQGLPVYQILGKQLGVTRDELDKLLKKGLDGGKVVDALTKGFTSGKMAKAAAAQANTVEGQFHNLIGRTTRTLGTMTEPLYNALATKVLPKVNDISKGVANWAAKGGMKQLGAAVSAGWAGKSESETKGFTGALGLVVKGVRVVAPYLKDFGRSVVDLFSAFAPALPILKPIGALLGGVLLGSLAGLTATVKILTPIIRIFAQILGWIGQRLGPLSPLIAKIGFVIGFLASPLGKAGALFRGFATAMKIASRIAFLVVVPLRAIISVARRVIGAVPGIARAIGRAMSSAAHAVSGFVSRAWGTLRGAVGKFVSAGADLAKGVGRGIGRAASSVLHAVKSLGDRAVRGFKAIASGMVDVGRSIVEGIANGIKSAPGVLRDAIVSIIPGGKLKEKFMSAVGLASGGIVRTPLQVVGERGPELVNLPMGSRVYDARTSAAMMKPSMAGGVTTEAHFYLDRREIATAVAREVADQRARR